MLATGVADTLPPVEGLAERWGTSVFHCPYCHGYELDAAQLTALASRDVNVETMPVVRIAGVADVMLADGAYTADGRPVRPVAYQRCKQFSRSTWLRHGV